MASRARQAVVPTYLFMCLLLGGSAQGIWANMILQLMGIAIIAWAAAAAPAEPLTPSAKYLFLLVALGLLLVTLQLAPLSASTWAHLGGRGPIAEQYRILGIPAPDRPLSITPYATLGTLLTLIPPLAVLCAMARMRAYRSGWLVLALLLGTVAGVLLGALQVTSADPLTSGWYLYAETNFGVATGFFANANHMASLLVIGLPFLAALLASARGGTIQRYSAVAALVAGVAAVLVIGIMLNGSLAGYVLAVPVLLASVLIVLSPAGRARRWIGLTSGLLLVAGAVALWMRPVGGGSFGAQAATSVQSRQEMVSTTLTAAKQFMPFGTGLGSFPRVYPLFEDPDSIVPTVVNHAHNDYAELALETGIPGLVLIAAFLIWWAAAVSRAWRSPEGGPYARAASIASAAILVHSLVDYPLRTAAISSVFAMCLALLVQRQAPAKAESSDLRPTRHVVFR
jgi:O-antigen ligase